MSEPCRFGYEEHDGARYCFEHAGFLEAGVQSRRCDRFDHPDVPKGATRFATRGPDYDKTWRP